MFKFWVPALPAQGLVGIKKLLDPPVILPSKIQVGLPGPTRAGLVPFFALLCRPLLRLLQLGQPCLVLPCPRQAVQLAQAPQFIGVGPDDAVPFVVPPNVHPADTHPPS